LLVGQRGEVGAPGIAAEFVEFERQRMVAEILGRTRRTRRPTGEVRAEQARQFAGDVARRGDVVPGGARGALGSSEVEPRRARRRT